MKESWKRHLFPQKILSSKAVFNIDNKTFLEQQISMLKLFLKDRMTGDSWGVMAAENSSNVLLFKYENILHLKT